MNQISSLFLTLCIAMSLFGCDELDTRKPPPVLVSPMERPNPKPATQPATTQKQDPRPVDDMDPDLVLPESVAIPGPSKPTTKEAFALLKAATRGDYKRTVKLCPISCDPNIADEEGNTPLHLAAVGGHRKVVAYLLKRRARVQYENNEGDRALLLAAAEGHVKVVKALLKAGAVVDSRDKRGHTPLHVASMEGKTQVVGILLAHGANIEKRSRRGRTPLMEALDGLNGKTARLLLKQGADPNARDNRSSSVLQLAIVKTDAATVKIILEKGAEIDRPAAGLLPLLHAASECNLDMVDMLLKRGADIASRAQDNKTALHMTCIRSDLALSKFLLKRGAEINAETDDGSTPLDYAQIAEEPNKRLLHLLIKRGAKANKKKPKGRHHH